MSIIIFMIIIGAICFFAGILFGKSLEERRRQRERKRIWRQEQAKLPRAINGKRVSTV